MNAALRRWLFLQAPARPMGARGAALLAGALVFLTAVFYRGLRPNDNAVTQFALTCAIVEHRSFSIDAYQDMEAFKSGDLAYYNGHYYSDKSPVASFLGIPGFAIYRGFKLATGGAVDYDAGRYFATLASAGGAAAILAMLTALALARRGVSARLAGMGGALWILATPLLGYSVFLYGYLPACAMILGANELLAPYYDAPSRRGAGRLFAAGLLMGLASWTLNTCALGALAMTAALVLSVLQGGDGGEGGAPWSRRLGAMAGRAWPWASGGALGVAGYFVYNRAVFGSIASPYRYEVTPLFRDAMGRGFMGAGWPRPRVAWLLTFHYFHGMFLWFPLTLAGFLGLAWNVWKREKTAPALALGSRGVCVESVAGLAFFLGLLAYNSGYFLWWGGSAYAPRHLLPGLAMLGLGLAPWLRCGPTRTARAVLAVAWISAVLNLAAIAINTHVGPGRPVEALMHPETVKSWTSVYLRALQFFRRARGDKNHPFYMNNWLGFMGRASLLPVYAAWAWAMAVLWIKGAPASRSGERKPPRQD